MVRAADTMRQATYDSESPLDGKADRFAHSAWSAPCLFEVTIPVAADVGRSRRSSGVESANCTGAAAALTVLHHPAKAVQVHAGRAALRRLAWLDLVRHARDRLGGSQLRRRPRQGRAPLQHAPMRQCVTMRWATCDTQRTTSTCDAYYTTQHACLWACLPACTPRALHDVRWRRRSAAS